MPWIDFEGQHVHICTRGARRPRCKFCSHRLSDKLCDFPTGKGKTCDASMCNCCATRVGPGLDYCPNHKGKQPAQTSLALGEVANG